MLAFAGEPLQPDTVGEQEVVERAVQAAEEDAEGAPVVLVRQRKGGGIEPAVGPVIVGGELPEMIDAHPWSPAGSTGNLA